MHLKNLKYINSQNNEINIKSSAKAIIKKGGKSNYKIISCKTLNDIKRRTGKKAKIKTKIKKEKF